MVTFSARKVTLTTQINSMIGISIARCIYQCVIRIISLNTIFLLIFAVIHRKVQLSMMLFEASEISAIVYDILYELVRADQSTYTLGKYEKGIQNTDRCTLYERGVR